MEIAWEDISMLDSLGFNIPSRNPPQITMPPTKRTGNRIHSNDDLIGKLYAMAIRTPRTKQIAIISEIIAAVLHVLCRITRFIFSRTVLLVWH